MARRQTLIQLDDARLAALDERAAASGRSRSDLIREAIDLLLDAVLPGEVRGHLRAARKERLLAMRSMVDVWIERVDRKPEARGRRRHESIPLEDA